MQGCSGSSVKPSLLNLAAHGAGQPREGAVTAFNINQLSGAIPPEFGKLTEVQELTLHNNRLSGAIPPELDNLTKVQKWDVEGNQLSGAIPPGLGNLAEGHELYLGDNQLASPIWRTSIVIRKVRTRTD